MKFTNVSKLVLAALCLILGVNGEETGEFLYKDTKICTRHKSRLCLAYHKKDNLVSLDSRHKLRWDIETVERVNMKINRVYTTTKDKATGKEVKSCLVREEIPEFGIFGLGLAPCDSDSKELVLALETPRVEPSKILLDEFILKEISYLDSGNTLSSSMCLTTMVVDNGALKPVSNRDEITRRTVLALGDCSSEYAQDFRARGFDRSSSSRLVATEEPAQVEAQIGRFCLSEQPGLCLGVSLENGETLVNDVFIQVKDYAKNEAKNLHDLKMRWYHDLQNDRIATASQLDYCIEGVYGAYTGDSRSGKPRYDDIVHLGACEASMRNIADEISEQLKDCPKSEIFYTKAITTPTASYLELRTDLPEGVEGTGPKCVSVVKCVKHEGDHCTKYNSIEVYDAADLETGAYARLKDCDSENMVSQRWYYVADSEVTMPPTKFPTPKPQTQSPTQFPTTNPPTKQPTTSTEEQPTDPPTNPPTDPTESENTPTVKRGAAALTAGLAFIGIMCLAVIIAAAAYYYKSQVPVSGDPQEDENFIARV